MRFTEKVVIIAFIDDSRKEELLYVFGHFGVSEKVYRILAVHLEMGESHHDDSDEGTERVEVGTSRRLNL